ncbi:hypothetical protein DPEC_G00230600 [Dallia pectoralis]|uniref:Uncharacterized protein n=1 Tax=Dallia pectoralis TaxID=75939 RepID=A0ACC2G224_DALPE|nr:hypothetical protein DPEC_G00230600 [Dallia pectoralis]
MSVSMSSLDCPRSSVFTFHSSVHSCHVLRCLDDQRKRDMLCDITVVVDGRSFRAHRSVLASCSDYFTHRVSSPAAQGLVITLPEEVSVKGFGPLLDFAYTSKLLFSKDSIMEIRQCASALGFRDLESACFDFLLPKFFRSSSPASIQRKTCCKSHCRKPIGETQRVDDKEPSTVSELPVEQEVGCGPCQSRQHSNDKTGSIKPDPAHEALIQSHTQTHQCPKYRKFQMACGKGRACLEVCRPQMNPGSTDLTEKFCPLTLPPSKFSSCLPCSRGGCVQIPGDSSSPISQTHSNQPGEGQKKRDGGKEKGEGVEETREGVLVVERRGGEDEEKKNMGEIKGDAVDVNGDRLDRTADWDSALNCIHSLRPIIISDNVPESSQGNPALDEGAAGAVSHKCPLGLGLDHQVLGLDHQGLGLDHQGLGLDHQGLGLDHQGLGLDHQGLGLDHQGLGLDHQGLGLDHQGLGLDHQGLGMDHQGLGLDHQGLGLDHQGLGMDHQGLGLDHQGLGLDHQGLGGVGEKNCVFGGRSIDSDFSISSQTHAEQKQEDRTDVEEHKEQGEKEIGKRERREHGCEGGCRVEREVAEHLVHGLWSEAACRPLLQDSVPGRETGAVDLQGRSPTMDWLNQLDLRSNTGHCPFLHKLDRETDRETGSGTDSGTGPGEDQLRGCEGSSYSEKSVSSVNSGDDGDSDCFDMEGDSEICSYSQRAKEVQLPFSVGRVLGLSRNDFQLMLRHHSLTREQLDFVQDVRRRSKNRVAAQRCRKRKLDCIHNLECEINKLRAEKDTLMCERTHLSQMSQNLRQRVSVLCQRVCSESAVKPEELLAKYTSMDCPLSALISPTDAASPGLGGLPEPLASQAACCFSSSALDTLKLPEPLASSSRDKPIDEELSGDWIIPQVHTCDQVTDESVVEQCDLHRHQSENAE